MNDYTLRVARPEDAAALLAIYTPYVEKTAITFEYTVPTAEDFCGRVRHTLEKYPYLVAEGEGAIVGYAYPVRSAHGRPMAGRPRSRFILRPGRREKALAVRFTRRSSASRGHRAFAIFMPAWPCRPKPTPI